MHGAPRHPRLLGGGWRTCGWRHGVADSARDGGSATPCDPCADGARVVAWEQRGDGFARRDVEEDAMAVIGWIGLGHMGGPMAAHLSS
ncbi:MAG TPA: hypothetical protein VFR98_00420, partial [Agromyces sp.]|nr:hypothetical protein [Agromyces sp.]